MKTFRIHLFLLLLPSLVALSQPIPVEGVIGQENYWYQHVVVRNFSANGKAGFFHVSSLHAFYDDYKTDEIMSQSYLTYKVTPGIVAAVGTFYATGPGLSPSFAVQLFKKYKDVFMMIVPRIDIKKNGSYEAMGLIEYRPLLFPSVNLYSRLQAMSNLTDDIHNRSYQNFRIGLDVKRVQFGFALNIDEYGKESKTRHNSGIFIRTEL